MYEYRGRLWEIGKLGGYATTDERRGTREGRVEEAAKAKPRIGKQARRHPAGLDWPESRVAIVCREAVPSRTRTFVPLLSQRNRRSKHGKGTRKKGECSKQSPLGPIVTGMLRERERGREDGRMMDDG